MGSDDLKRRRLWWRRWPRPQKCVSAPRVFGVLVLIVMLMMGMGGLLPMAWIGISSGAGGCDEELIDPNAKYGRFKRTLSPAFRYWHREARCHPRTEQSCAQRFAHFQALHERLKGLKLVGAPEHDYGNYNGPWIENHWIRRNKELLEGTSEEFCKRFGTFVPLLAQWVDFMVQVQGPTYYKYCNAVGAMLEQLSEKFLYATVTQNDRGIVHGCFKNYSEPYKGRPIRLLVFSAGGYGQVPIPLIKGEKKLERLPTDNPSFTNDITFCGSVNGARPLRVNLIPHLKKTMGDRWRKCDQQEWEREWSRVKYVLIPRGFGRSAFMVAEAIQKGFVPVYVYSDVNWAPYLSDDWPFGVAVDEKTAHDNLTAVLEAANLRYDEYRETIFKFRDLWTYDGVLSEIERTLRDRIPPDTDFEFVDWPSSIRGYD